MALKRRDFLKLIGATTVATGLPGCIPKKPKSLIPYIIPHEEIIPGRSVWYASICRECPAGCGVTVRVREGRATKVEGNALHPVNRGALCARGQAALQGLYNPDRIQTPLRRTPHGTWEQLTWQQAEELFLSQVREVVSKGRGREIVWLTPLLTGSLDSLVDEWLDVVGPGLRYSYEPFGYEALRRANGLTFGTTTIPAYDFGSADFVLSFGADFLETWISPVGYARDFASLRGSDGSHRNRFVYLGPRLSMTAASADDWIGIHPDRLGDVALSMVNVILREGINAPLPAEERALIGSIAGTRRAEVVAPTTDVAAERITELARAFAHSHGVAVAGGPGVDGEFATQCAAGVNLLNYICGNIGRSIRFGPEHALARLQPFGFVEGLVRMMERDEVSMLLLNDVNPAFSMPATGIAEAIRKVPSVVSFSSTMDETTALASLILPIHTPLECWGDSEPQNGIHGLMQPVMQPVFPTKMLGDLLLETGRKLSSPAAFPAATFRDYLQERWKELHRRLGRGESFEAFWVESLARGGVWEEPRTRQIRLSRALTASTFEGPKEVGSRSDKTLALLTYPSVGLFDGRGANKPWLQELPDPMTRLVWGSWAELCPEDALRLGFSEGDGIQIASPYAKRELPVHITNGMKPGFIAVPLGQGHTEFGRYASGVGVNAFEFLDPKSSPDGSAGRVWACTAVEILPLPKKIPLASVQKEGSEHDRDIVQETPLPLAIRRQALERQEEPSLYPPQEYPKHEWGMVIDIDKCTGCGACVIACYAENNIPVVGREEVMNGRVMTWLRIDRYYVGGAGHLAEPLRARFLPMLCQQCGDAPCETVCPVYAAYHTEEGLNGQVYNRCIGTRYCANNCPYKVRRFNWFEHDWPEPLNWQLNPDVTVRSKGVMEKCTFCVQRIVEGKNNARMERRNVVDGEIRTACEQSCPAHAITFGDLKDAESRASKLSAPDQPRGYRVLQELNTRPAITYLKKIIDHL